MKKTQSIEVRNPQPQSFEAGMAHFKDATVTLYRAILEFQEGPSHTLSLKEWNAIFCLHKKLEATCRKLSDRSIAKGAAQ